MLLIHPENFPLLNQAAYSGTIKAMLSAALALLVEAEESFGLIHAQTVCNIYSVYVELALYHKASALLEQLKDSLDAIEDDTRYEHSVVLYSLANIAECYRRIGKYAESAALSQRIIDCRPGSTKLELYALLTYVSTLRTLGNYEIADSYIEQADRIISTVTDSPLIISSYFRKRGSLLRSKGLYAEAKHVFMEGEAFNIYTNLSCHYEHGRLVGCIAELHRSKGEFALARHSYAKALSILRLAYQGQHVEIGYQLGNLGEYYRAIGDYNQAERSYLRCLAMLKTGLGEDHPDYAKRLNNLAQLYRATGRTEQAQDLLWKALETLTAAFGSHHHHVAKVMNNLSALSLELGDTELAQQMGERALHIRLQVLGDNHHHVGRSYLNLARLSVSGGHTHRAIEYYRLAIESFEKSLGPAHSATAQAQQELTTLTIALKMDN